MSPLPDLKIGKNKLPTWDEMPWTQITEFVLFCAVAYASINLLIYLQAMDAKNDGQSKQLSTIFEHKNLIFLAVFGAGAGVTIFNPNVIKWSRLSEYVSVGAGSYYASHKLAQLSGVALWLPISLRDSVNGLVALLGDGVFALMRSAVAFYNPVVVTNEALAKELKAAEGHVHRTRDELKQSRDHLLNIKFKHDESSTSIWHAQESLRNHQEDYYIAGKDLEKKQEESRQQERRERRAKRKDRTILSVGTFAFVLALIALGLFMMLRSACDVPFDSRDWLAKQQVQNALSANEDAEKLKRAHAAPVPMSKATENDKGAVEVKPIVDPNTLAHVPDFIDIERQQVFLPLFYPTSIKDYLQTVGKANDMDGLNYMLSMEPDHLFDMIEKEAFFQVGVTNNLFLILDVLIIALSAMGLACTFDIPSMIGGAMAGEG